MKRPLLIGVTGTIASGKSEFCRILSESYEVIDTDELAKNWLHNKVVIATLVERWGQKVQTDAGLDLGEISNIVFSNPSELKYLNLFILRCL
jgi:dephospho-CoA kinase